VATATKDRSGDFLFRNGHVFTDEFCYINTGYFQRRESRIIDPKLIAVDLTDGKTAWEVSASGEAGGMTLSDGVLYMITAKGVVAAYEAKNGRMSWNLDLEEGEHHASYGGSNIAATHSS
jgi:outer membrane protein assembly factor BamB